MFAYSTWRMGHLASEQMDMCTFQHFVWPEISSTVSLLGKGTRGLELALRPIPGQLTNSDFKSVKKEGHGEHLRSCQGLGSGTGMKSIADRNSVIKIPIMVKRQYRRPWLTSSTWAPPTSCIQYEIQFGSPSSIVCGLSSFPGTKVKKPVL